MSRTVIALFDDSRHAHEAVENLVGERFSREAISLITPPAHGEPSTPGDEGAPSATATGAGAGAVLGGLGGLVVGLGALTLPGIGPVLAAGPLTTALAGAGVGAAAGGLVGALMDQGVPEDRARDYEEGLRRGGTLVILRTTADRAPIAETMLDRHGAVDIVERSAAWRGERAA
jgi:uncharacterized membrane protein